MNFVKYKDSRNGVCMHKSSNQERLDFSISSIPTFQPNVSSSVKSAVLDVSSAVINAANTTAGEIAMIV
ncbi:41630_t:CDS:2 [Gigaspora margarita]|uniref:41630_t:CDS:1 n=1 Tax=Gigaspora margarita TaxID=4874 RepID=A0ABN7UM38_GIGMA|nr:41630_t:CDS:2 [Gigaspora margarita]